MDLDVDGGDVFPEEDNYSKTPEVGLGADSTSKFAAPWVVCRRGHQRVGSAIYYTSHS